VVPEPGQRDAAKWRVNSWSLRTKVAVVLVVPAAVALVLGGVRVSSQLDEANRLSAVRDQLTVLQDAVSLADLVALEMVAAVPPIPGERVERQAAVDEKIAAIRDNAGFASLPGDVSRKLSDALDGLSDARQQAATNDKDPVTEAFAYREAIADLGELMPRAVSFARADELDDRAATVLSLLLMRAALASEEALIATGNGAPVSADVAASVQHSSAEEAVLVQQLAVAFPAAELPRFAKATQSWSGRRDAIQDAVAKNRTADLQKLLPGLRDEAADLRTLADERFTGLVDTFSVRTNEARSDALRDAAIVLGALLAALAIALTVARSLLLPVRKLRAAALSVAHDQLPKTVERVRGGERVDWRTVEPLALHTDEEIGQLARAFDDMHQQAVRLAGEQAELRHQVSEMFMTLSRRSQSLVELQLGVIESLEADEHDPRRLDGLFRLDHLATRLRRNGENLQVLAGGTPAKRGNRPVSVVEMLRAATSEVKDYRRVTLGHAPNASVRASAASDVVHILAELLENATRFSPPDRKVVLSADRGADGGLLFEVIDAGLGMAPDDLDGANDRLATTDAIGPETTRRMGLFVVGLLAARHHVTVRLRSTYDRAKQAGITASVHVPGALVRVDGTPETAAPAAAPTPPVPADSTIADRLTTTGPQPVVPPAHTTNGSAIGWFTPVLAVEDDEFPDDSPDSPADFPADFPAETTVVTPSVSSIVTATGRTEADDEEEPAARGWLTPALQANPPPTPTPRAPLEPPITLATKRSAKAATSDTSAAGNATNSARGAKKTMAGDPPTIRTTPAGLPRRVPRSGTPPTRSNGRPAKADSGFRDPDTIRSNLSRHYSGMQAARRAREEPDSASAPERED
jgi:signal transduction histidine kinase